MKSYTVHFPPHNNEDTDIDRRLEQATFVVDGFAPFAMITPPLWLLWHRQWLGLILFFAFLLGLDMAGFLISYWAQAIIYSIFAFGFGLEANTLKRWRLHAYGWQQVDAFVAADLEDAEERFFARFKTTQDLSEQSPAVPKAPPSFISTKAHNPQIIGFS